VSAKAQEPISGRGYGMEIFTFGHLFYQPPMLENMSVDVVDCTRVKDVLKVFGGREGVNYVPP
jgi:hypothetical protein